MESEYRKGYVYIQKIFAGTIAETEEGYEFSYNEDYLKREDAVSGSLTLPLLLMTKIIDTTGVDDD